MLDDYWTNPNEYILAGGMRMEVIFEYEIDGVRYTESNPPHRFIEDLLNALIPPVIPTLKRGD